jgi:ABC-type branched-subunit amino acid transport system substrate-binding protein
MSDRQRAILFLVFGALSALLVSPRLAAAQSGGDSMWTALDVVKTINGAIEESNDRVELREKIVRRFSECSLMYGGLSTMASNAEARKNYVEAQHATAEVEFALAKPLQSARRVELEESARQSVAMMLRAINAQGKKEANKEVGPLLKSCKALNDVKELKSALRELSRS